MENVLLNKIVMIISSHLPLPSKKNHYELCNYAKIISKSVASFYTDSNMQALVSLVICYTYVILIVLDY